MGAQPFNLALAQIFVQPGDKPGNLERACAFISRATESGSQMVLLPEALTTGWGDRSALTDADSIPDGETCLVLRAQARSNEIFVCAGVAERSKDQIFNAAVLIDPTGEVILHHRKIYELEIAHHLYALGDNLSVTETRFGKIGVMICADGFAPDQCITRSLALMGADIILSPCAWAVPPGHDNNRDPYGSLWIDNYGPVARQFRVWIAGVSNVGPIRHGPWAGHKCIGSSLVVNPRGEKEFQAPYGETAEVLSSVKIIPEIRPARGGSWERFWEKSPSS